MHCESMQLVTAVRHIHLSQWHMKFCSLMCTDLKVTQKFYSVAVVQLKIFCVELFINYYIKVNILVTLKFSLENKSDISDTKTPHSHCKMLAGII